MAVSVLLVSEDVAVVVVAVDAAAELPLVLEEDVVLSVDVLLLVLLEVVDAALALTLAIISFVLADEIELIVERSIKTASMR